MAMTGSCVCGAVAFRVAGAGYPLTWCHCTLCRKYHGYAIPAVAVPNRDFVWQDGAEESVRWYHTSEKGQRGGCKACGSALFYREIDEERISIAAGVLDNPTDINPHDHIFTADKGDWYEIAEDGTPRHEGHWPEGAKPDLTGDKSER